MQGGSPSYGGRAWCACSAVVVATVLGLAATGHTAEAAKIDSGDTAWMLTSAALVLISSSASAFVATNTATGAAALFWMSAEWLHKGKPTVLGAASGAVAGLVAITPASGFVAPMPALMIGAAAGVLCYGACNLKSILGWYDDALDVVGVHGVGGTWGAIATGLWASSQINPDVFAPKGPAVSEGLFISGQWGLLGNQALAVLVSYGLAIVGSLVCLAITSLVVGGLRANDDDEFAGLDLSQHRENAYVFATGGYGGGTSFSSPGRPLERRGALGGSAME